MSFFSELDFRLLPDGRKKLLREFVYNDPRLGPIRVYEGFVTTNYKNKGIRARWWGKTIELGWGRCERAEIIRDYLYNLGLLDVRVPSRSAASAIYMRAMRLEGVVLWRRAVLRFTLFLLGGSLWKGWDRRRLR